MSEVVSLVAARRPRVGKGGARAARRSGAVPAVIYGDHKDPVAIAVEPAQLNKQLHAPGFFSRVFEIDVDGVKQRVLARDVQRDPLSGAPLHVDFMRFGATTKVTVEVDVQFLNEDTCPGLKQGGVLNIVRHAIEVVCKPDHIPTQLIVDLAGFEIGDVAHLSDVPLPPAVEFADDDLQMVVATIAPPTVAPVEEEAAETETKEPEIIKSKGKEQPE